MGTLRVDFAALRTRAQDLETAFDEADALLTRLEQELAEALGDWLGDGRSAFARRYAEWVAAARQLHADLPRIRDFVLTAHDNHGAALSANLDIWRGTDR
ncbi:WXG100 family type VII secretion target [Amycolatopsis sp. NPDC098790]|uniref:WXG100 family type VII secretion target n=1 Tax=Amycolatopsis sp. NPDC098790 TaxID=3363939 RepID=UPI0037F299DB